MSSIDRKHLFLFLIFLGAGSQRLILCRYLSIDFWVGDLSERSVTWTLLIFSFWGLGQCFERAHLFLPLETSLSGEALAGRIIVVIFLLSQSVLFCHRVEPLRFLFWEERLRNTVSSLRWIKHLSHTDGFPNQILAPESLVMEIWVLWSADHGWLYPTGPHSWLRLYML